MKKQQFRERTYD